MAEDYSEKIAVRKVTTVHANWSDQGTEEEGKFSFQLILDDGAEEAVIRPPGEDADVLQELVARSEDLYFDLERRVLIFRSIS